MSEWTPTGPFDTETEARAATSWAPPATLDDEWRDDAAKARRERINTALDRTGVPVGAHDLTFLEWLATLDDEVVAGLIERAYVASAVKA
jgi:hypothetical protein